MLTQFLISEYDYRGLLIRLAKFYWHNIITYRGYLYFWIVLWHTHLQTHVFCDSNLNWCAIQIFKSIPSSLCRKLLGITDKHNTWYYLLNNFVATGNNVNSWFLYFMKLFLFYAYLLEIIICFLRGVSINFYLPKLLTKVDHFRLWIQYLWCHKY